MVNKRELRKISEIDPKEQDRRGKSVLLFLPFLAYQIQQIYHHLYGHMTLDEIIERVLKKSDKEKETKEKVFNTEINSIDGIITIHDMIVTVDYPEEKMNGSSLNPSSFILNIEPESSKVSEKEFANRRSLYLCNLYNKQNRLNKEITNTREFYKNAASVSTLWIKKYSSKTKKNTIQVETLLKGKAPNEHSIHGLCYKDNSELLPLLQSIVINLGDEGWEIRNDIFGFYYTLLFEDYEKMEAMCHDLDIQLLEEEKEEMTLLDFIKEGNQEIGREKGRIEGERAGRIEGKREGRVEGIKEGKIEGKVEERENLLKRIYELSKKKYSSERILNDLIQELSSQF